MLARFRPCLSTVLLGIVYLLLAAAALKLTRFQGGVAFISIANAALLAHLLVLRRENWVPSLAVCAVASAIATAWVGLGPLAALPMTVANIGEVLIAAAILHRVSAQHGGLGSYAPLAWFLLAAGVVAPAVGAFGGAAVAATLGADTYWRNWANWFAGHALGALTFTPVIVYILRGDAREWARVVRPAAAAEATVLTLLVAAVSAVVFAQDTMPLLFVPMLPIILATFRIGRLAAAASVVLLAVIGGWLTITGHGPIGLLQVSFGQRVQFLQLYLASTVLTILPVGAELARRAALYKRLHDSEARYRLLTENSTDIVLNIDVAGRIRFASPSIRQLGGHDPDAVVGRAAIDLVEPDDAPAVIRAHHAALADPTRTIIVEYRARGASGETRWFEAHTRAVTDEAGEVTGVVSAIRDVGHRKSVERRLSHAALTDPLTGIANRRAFDAQLDRAVEMAGAAGFGCVALFDLDHFKGVNDRHGHAAGDAVLRAFADLVRGRMRDMDFIARVGGEEFAVILPGTAPEQARFICDRLRATLAATPVVVGEASIAVTVSGGVARYDGAMVPAALLAAADAALYEAKRAGRDRMRLAA